MSENIVLKISGMHCQSCKTLLETEIKSLPDVEAVKVDFPSGRAEIKAEQTKKIVSRIIAKIKEHGYGAEVIDNSRESGGSSPVKKDDFEIRAVKYILIGLGIIILFGIYFLLEKNGALQIFSRLQE